MAAIIGKVNCSDGHQAGGWMSLCTPMNRPSGAIHLATLKFHPPRGAPVSGSTLTFLGTMVAERRASVIWRALKRHINGQQDAHRRDPPGRDPGGRGAWKPR